MEFKVGDRVKVNKPKDVDEYPSWVSLMDPFAGTIQTISNISSSGNISFQDGESWSFSKTWLEPVKKQLTIKMKITNAFKKFLSPELQAQIKAGYRDQGLNLTEQGKTALLEILADENKDAFTASANEEVAEQEKQK